MTARKLTLKALQERKRPTDKQAEILDLMIDHMQEHQRYPTFPEMSEALGIHVNAVKFRVDGLVRKGWLESKGEVRGRGYTIVGLCLAAHLPDATWGRHTVFPGLTP